MAASTRVFISYDTNDYHTAINLFEKLQLHGQRPWIDKSGLIGGDDWEKLIPPLINNECDYFISLLSKSSVQNKRYFSREFSFAIEKMKTMMPGRKFIIPVKIDDCEIPEFAKPFHVVNLDKNEDFSSLYTALDINTIHGTHGFMEGSWIGYTIEDVSIFGGKEKQVFPCLCELKINHNLLVGELSICYMNIGPTVYAKLSVIGVPRVDTIKFKWKNVDENIEQEGITILEIKSETKLVGSFNAEGVDAKVQFGSAAFYKVDFDYKRTLKSLK